MSKSTTYRQTIRSHRILLSLPIILAVAIAGVLTLGKAKTYESTVSLWVDNPASSDSSLGTLNPGMTPPSTVEQGVVTELLATPSFDLTVANRSQLGRYLASNGSGGVSLSSLTGGGNVPLKVKIISALGPAKVTTTVPGPQVLQISYLGPTPAVAQSTLNAIVDQLEHDSAQLGALHTQDSVDYYQTQVQSADRALLSAQHQAQQYRAAHPTAGRADPNLAAISAQETSAGAQLTQAQAGLSAAESALKGGDTAAVVKVIDPATFPVGPTSGKKKDVEGVMAGLVAGLVISFLGVLALTKRKSDPWEDELAEAVAAGYNGTVVSPDAASAFEMAVVNGHGTYAESLASPPR